MRGRQRPKVRFERRLRRDATDAETKLWFALRDRRLAGFKFVRQEAIGSYVVDVVCRKNWSSKLTVGSTRIILGITGAMPCSAQTAITYCDSGIRMSCATRKAFSPQSLGNCRA